jgi:hypothetical protein
MTIEILCPNGHKLKVKDEFAGKAGLCPCCKARVQVPKKEEPLDDDILSMLESPGVSCSQPKPQPQSDDVLNELFSRDKPKKTCPGCGGKCSLAFTTCPRCGTPLPSAPRPK